MFNYNLKELKFDHKGLSILLASMSNLIIRGYFIKIEKKKHHWNVQLNLLHNNCMNINKKQHDQRGTWVNAVVDTLTFSHLPQVLLIPEETVEERVHHV